MTSSYMLRAVFKLIDDSEFSYRRLSKKTGLSISSFTPWRQGVNTPNILAVEEIAEALGYRLKLEKINDG